TASRTVGLLGAIFTYAVKHRMRSDNPVHGVIRFADGARERRLSDDEYKSLGDALRNAEAANIWPAAVAAGRFPALTGWRSGEAVDLYWENLNLDRRVALLPDGRPGSYRVPLATSCGASRARLSGYFLRRGSTVACQVSQSCLLASRASGACLRT